MATVEQLTRLADAALSVLRRDNSSDARSVFDALNRLIATARLREQSTHDLVTRKPVA